MRMNRARPRTSCPGARGGPFIAAEALESRVHLAASPLDAPLPPRDLRVRPISPTQASLTWVDGSFDEVGYVVQRRGPQDADFYDVATVPKYPTAYTDTVDPTAYPPGTPVAYRVAMYNDAGRSTPAGPVNVIVGGPGGTGLRERVWDDLNPASHEGAGEPVYDGVDPIVRHGYGVAAPAPGVGADTFAIEWVGEFVAEETKAYDISVVGNDGVRLFLDGKPVIAGGWREQDEAEYFAGPMQLTAGQHVKVRLQMYDQSGAATARLLWNGPGNANEEIPTAFLFPVVGAGDAVAELPVRPATNASAFALPATETTPASIAVRWQDNAFGETGYKVRRATDAQFTQDLVTFPALAGSDLFVDTGDVAPLDPDTRYYYQVRPADAAAWTDAGSARIADSIEPQRGFEVPRFDDARAVTLNGYASTTAEGTLKLVHNQNDRTGTAFFNRAFALYGDFEASFDIRISDSTGADGMAFVIHNAAAPDPRSGVPNQLRAVGQSGGGLGYAFLPNSVALAFDLFNDRDQIGVFTNGAGAGDDPRATYVNDAAHWPLPSNGTVDLRAGPVSPAGGTSTVNLDGGTVWRVKFKYDLDDAGTPAEPDDDSGLVTIEIRRADASSLSVPLVRTQYAVDLVRTIGGPLGVMGFTASNGGLNARQEVLRFDYHPIIIEPPPPPYIADVYVNGDAWGASFKSYLASRGLGDANFGYRLVSNGVPVAGPEQILPWINLNQLVLKFSSAAIPSELPSTSGIVLTSQQGVQYVAVAITPVAGDPAAFVVTLNQPLGGGKPVFGLSPTARENGDRITLSLRGQGVNGADFSLRMNVLQGDTDHSGESGSHSVLASDYSAVRKKFFKNITDAPTGADTDYSPFHDVNGDGVILANDFSEVKKRFFQQMPPPPAATAFGSPLPPPFDTRRPRPAGRDVLG